MTFLSITAASLASREMRQLDFGCLFGSRLHSSSSLIRYPWTQHEADIIKGVLLFGVVYFWGLTESGNVHGTAYLVLCMVPTYLFIT